MMKKTMMIMALFVSAILFGACGNTEKESADNENDAIQESTVTEEETDQAEETLDPQNMNENDETSSLQLLENDKSGEYLADSKGQALYYFTKDEPETSNCSGECLDNWPPFVEKDFDVPEGYDKSDFGTITREDTSAEQVTYKGYPLYYFAKDQNEGDVKGQGVKEVWYIVNKETKFN